MLKSPDEMRAERYETRTMDQLERLHIQVQIETLDRRNLQRRPSSRTRVIC
jgi:hypothetical protein